MLCANSTQNLDDLAYAAVFRLLYTANSMPQSLSAYQRIVRGSAIAVDPSTHTRYLAALLFYFATVFNVSLCIICWTIYSQDPRNFIQILITCPVISVAGQRLILNLRRFRGQPDTSHNFGLMANREVAVMDDRYCQSGHGVGSAARDGTSSGMIRMVDLHSHSHSLDHRGEGVLDKVGELHP